MSSILRPGSRILGYRNSRPRDVKLLGIGDGAWEAAAAVRTANLPNVSLHRQSASEPLPPLDAPQWGRLPNMIMVVYRVGDRIALPTFSVKPDPLVTFVLLEPLQHFSQGHNREVQALRSISDLFVTTSDTDFVFDLVSNLAA